MGYNYFWLVVWNMIFMTFHIGNVIIPTDELHDFSQPPPTRSLLTIINHHHNHILTTMGQPPSVSIIFPFPCDGMFPPPWSKKVVFSEVWWSSRHTWDLCWIPWTSWTTTYLRCTADDVHIFQKKHGYDFETKPFLCFSDFSGDVFFNINSKMLWHLTILSSIFRLYSMHSLVATKYR